MRIPYPIYEAIERYAVAFAEHASRPGESLDSCAQCHTPATQATKEHLCSHLDAYTFPVELLAAALGESPANDPEALREHLVTYLRSEMTRDDRPGDPAKLRTLVRLRLKPRAGRPKSHEPRRSRAMTPEQKVERLKNIHVRYTTQVPYTGRVRVDPVSQMVVYKWATPVEAFSCCCLDKVPEPFKSDMQTELARRRLVVKEFDGVDYCVVSLSG